MTKQKKKSSAKPSLATLVGKTIKKISLSNSRSDLDIIFKDGEHVRISYFGVAADGGDQDGVELTVERVMKVEKIVEEEVKTSFEG